MSGQGGQDFMGGLLTPDPSPSRHFFSPKFFTNPKSAILSFFLSESTKRTRSREIVIRNATEGELSFPRTVYWFQVAVNESVRELTAGRPLVAIVHKVESIDNLNQIAPYGRGWHACISDMRSLDLVREGSTLAQLHVIISRAPKTNLKQYTHLH